MKSKQTVREKIKNLIDRYKKLEEEKGVRGLKETSESDVRSNFIDELFSILGWDTKNPNEYNREKYVRGVGYADITLQVDGQPVIFVEAKRFGSIPEVDRQTTDWIEEERQVMNYAASPERRIKWAILTNFEKLRVFNALNGLLVMEIKGPYQYERRLEELLYLSREAVMEGRLDKLATREERPDIDEQFLESLEKWRLSLANDIYEQNKENEVLLGGDEISLDKLKSAVQRILDRLIIVRYAEDKLILDNPDQLKSILESWKLTSTYTSLYEMVKNFFIGFDEIHNSKLFEQGHISERVKIGSEVLAEIINELYQINFRKFDFDVLGNTYETYLGHELYFTDAGKLDLRASRGTRKKSGIYYTPPYVVDYIVKNTVGEMLKNKTPDEVSQLRILDPACGSGSFLIKAFDYFAQYYAEENEKRREEIRKKLEKYQKSGDNSIHAFDNSGLELVRDFEKKILEENIYGVDLDEQAAEIASVNLVLKALTKGEKLPLILGENIKVGNSLISGSEEELRKYFGDAWRKKKPFNWEKSFPEIFDSALPEEERGFDVVIGNPPYIRTHQLSKDDREFFNKTFSTSKGQYDIFILFIEKGLKLLRNGGRLGFIISSKFATSDYGLKLREFILDNCVIEQALDLSTIPVFGDASVYPYIIILRKENNKDLRDMNTIKVGIADSVDEFRKEGYKILKIPQKRYQENNYFIFDTVSEKAYTIIKKVEKKGIYLGDICNITRGFRPPPEDLVISEYEYPNVSNERKKYYKKLIRGGDLKDRYSVVWDGKYVEYIQEKIYESKPAEIFDNPKILIRDISTRPLACYDDKGYFPLKTIYTLHQKDKSYHLKYITAILNSSVIQFYSKEKFWSAHIGGEYLRFRKQYLLQIPVPQAPLKKQGEINILVDKMLSLNEQANEINVDFGHYVGLHKRVDDIHLGRFLEKIGVDVEEKEVLNYANQKEGKVVGFEVSEEGEWLLFTVEYERKTRKKNIERAKMRAFRCKIADEKMRKFLYYSIKEFVTPSKVGKGNLYERILKINVPRFHNNWEKNVKIINEIMNTYLPRIQKWQQLQEEIKATDQQIDQMVYDLYGLTEEEIRIVEESLGER